MDELGGERLVQCEGGGFRAAVGAQLGGTGVGRSGGGGEDVAAVDLRGGSVGASVGGGREELTEITESDESVGNGEIGRGTNDGAGTRAECSGLRRR